ncbi:MAG: hypothetical protein AAGF88_10665 [Pseudomonadota bacterium]
MPNRPPVVPRLACILVEADVEAVLGFIRGEATARRQDAEAQGGAAFCDIHEISGADAQIHRPFGPQASHLTQFPDQKFIETTFDLRGWRRVSRPKSNPNFVLYEEFLDHVTDVHARHLQHWTSSKTYLIQSQIAPYPTLTREQSIVLGVVDAIGEHVFTAIDDHKMRSLSYIRWDGPMQLNMWGAPLPFEDSYDDLHSSEVLTRSRIYTYLERLGIDPVATFERRELTDAVLFSEDHPGPSASGYPDEADRYRDMVEGEGWFPKVAAGHWF